MPFNELSSETLVALFEHLLRLIEEKQTSTEFTGIYIEEKKNRHNDYNVVVKFIYNFRRYRAHIESSSYGTSYSILVMDAQSDYQYGKVINMETYDRLSDRLRKIIKQTGSIPEDFDAVLAGLERKMTIDNILETL